MTAKSGSQPQNGQWPWRQVERSTRCISASAQRARNGRSASTSTWSRLGGRSGGAALAGRVRVDAARSRVPLRDERLERVAVAAERHDLLVVGALERLEAVEDVGGLAERQAEVGPLERDVAEADSGPPGRLLRAQPLGSAWIHGSGTRACTRRCISTSAICMSTADASSGWALFSCLSSTISRGSARGGAAGGRSRLNCTGCIGDGGCALAYNAAPQPSCRADRDAKRRHAASVLIIGSEALPFAKTGGLADVLGALPPALARLGWDVTVALPRYRGVDGGHVASTRFR